MENLSILHYIMLRIIVMIQSFVVEIWKNKIKMYSYFLTVNDNFF